ncbi:CRISPR-associated helicase/endonuclease Cas3 [Pseudomonas sp. ENNP23]|uniref:CRISPR-associated helicase/endonuclease Cas3 n=1 Tax=Pseudomonas sp. ENNP23 TaxID=1535636 RepID=UPI00084B0E82|nr:CRISPR-associated helicase/endonuclease Cas3 [Pseudomonas sp. ENNP23]OEC59790.1 CRISPR-associated helicase/endonuclease Cas3 [Pseudomonas sp. ENNP23]
MDTEHLVAFSALSAAARGLWAKSGEPTGHGLLAHLLDVAAVVESLLAIEPPSTRQWAATAFGLDPTACPRWIAALAGLHDFGKGIPGFQAKWKEDMQADQAHGLAFSILAQRVDRHDLATAALLESVLDSLAVASSDWLQQVVRAVSAHHGYHFQPTEVQNGTPPAEVPAWAAVRAEVFSAFWHLLAPQGRPSAERLPLAAINWLAGLTSAADWIASNPEWFSLGERGFDDLRAYYADAGERARTALARIGWQPYRGLAPEGLDTDAALRRIVGRDDLSARPLQQAGDRLMHGVNEPALLLVEAPMGEGKTELAFLAHLRLQAANQHRGLYVALPTQATGNALFQRAGTFLDAFRQGPLDLQLVHGGAALNDDIQRLRGIAEDPQESLAASAWFAQRRRPLLSPYGVGTVDQALFGVLNVKHHFVRLWGLANRVVVLDEVHAYDAYTNGLIVVLLRWLKAMGCSVVLMSATLPAARRNELLRAWAVDAASIPEQAYPRLLLATGGQVQGESFKARDQAPIQLAPLGESLEALAEAALDLLAGGGCGALIVNTVERAQQLYRHLREQLGKSATLLLFHARFPADQRAQREREVLAAFGATGERPARALLVATQVAEQSLDIDFDFMLSDLAPVDLLLQRAGRLHRHTRSARPERHQQARLHIAGLGREAPPDLKDTAWGYVYDPYILLRTWALLRDEAQLQLPGDIDRLVQLVYGDEPLPEDLEDAIQTQIEIERYGEYLARLKKERQEAQNIAIDPRDPLDEAYANKPKGHEEGEGTGWENKTRLGRESITLIPLEVTAEGWRPRLGEPAFDPASPVPDALARRLCARQLKVSRTALVKRLKAEPPPAFQNPLLRNAYPLPLQAGLYADAGLHLRLDDELGLVYEPTEAPNKEHP